MSPQVYIGEDQETGDSLTTGEGVPSRSSGCTNAGSGILTGNQTLRFTFFNARKGILTTQVRVLSGSTAAGATPTLCRLGLYLFARDSQNVLTGTLVASTANDTALFAAASTSYTRSWSAPYQMQAGQRYALAVLVVTAATAPTLVGRSMVSADEAALAPRLSGQLTGQADLPATFVDSALAVSGSAPYAAILP